jgi:hypothetical protein
LPTMTFSTLAMSCRAIVETSGMVSRFDSEIGGKVIFGFFPVVGHGGKGISMRLTFQKSGGGATNFFNLVCSAGATMVSRGTPLFSSNVI